MSQPLPDDNVLIRSYLQLFTGGILAYSCKIEVVTRLMGSIYSNEYNKRYSKGQYVHVDFFHLYLR